MTTPTNLVRFLALFFVALALGPAMAHLLELPNKIGLTRDEYLIVQQVTNHRTDNWTLLPENWMSLRAQWEYSHAGSALLNLAALVSLIVASLRWETGVQRP